MTTTAQQFGRVIRLFILTFTHSAWLGLVSAGWSRTALVSVAVAASEAAYRAIQPSVSDGLQAAQNDHLEQIIENVVKRLSDKQTGAVAQPAKTVTTTVSETKTQ